MFNIMVTGAKGQLGSEIRYISKSYDHRFYFLDIEEYDYPQSYQ
jgi:dTDP-4-dehydrorhamnose reductase